MYPQKSLEAFGGLTDPTMIKVIFLTKPILTFSGTHVLFVLGGTNLAFAIVFVYH